MQEQGRGYVFTPRHLTTFGSRDAVASALKRYKAQGLIRQLTRGLYDYPIIDPLLGTIPASIDTIARAIAFRDAVSIQPTGAFAAHALGLSEQVPTRAVYLTDGRSQRIAIGRRELVLKHTTPRNMAVAGTISGLVFQTLRYYGPDQLHDELLTRIRRKLKAADVDQIRHDLMYAPAWIARALHPWLQGE